MLYPLSILLLLGVVACSTASDNSETTTATPTVTSSGFNSVEPSIGGLLEWRPTSNNTALEVRVTMPTTGWVGFGISSTSGSNMRGASSSIANIITGDVTGSDVTLTDRVSSGTRTPSSDSVQNVTAVSGGSSESDGNTTIHFTIPLESGDTSQDIPLSLDTNYDFLVAYRNGTSFIQHSSRARITNQSLQVTE